MTEQDPPWMSAEHRRNLAGLLSLQTHDVICVCGHWIEEHNEPSDYVACEGYCHCGCQTFQFDEDQNSPEVIAERGGDVHGHGPLCACGLCRIRPQHKIAAAMKRRSHEDGNGQR